MRFIDFWIALTPCITQAVERRWAWGASGKGQVRAKGVVFVSRLSVFVSCLSLSVSWLSGDAGGLPRFALMMQVL